eukprot:comp22676_c0_seq1/m.35064 comp22676_c0_seq1/g.35064  ORF comp22676_c0_seq1/g.35064 comp22676_c0_seq1/m.35064 type:complete len:457 (-) comp22676_c0_seq1:42-1412(-)
MSLLLARIPTLSVLCGQRGARHLSLFSPPPPPPHRRVVVTGLGLVTPLAVGVKETWERLIAGQCGIDTLSGKEYEGLPTNVAALVPRGSEPHMWRDDDWLQPGDSKRVPPFVSFALSAAQQALSDANWAPTTDEDKQASGVSIGVGMVGLNDIAQTSASLNDPKQGYKRVSPFFVPRILVNMASGHVSIRHGLQGPNHAVSTACATGAHGIGDAFRMIRDGSADVMVAGGTESCVSPLSIAGFARVKALATKYNKTPKEASRPFDKDRDGFVMGEGAGVVVLEEYEHAKQRGAKIYAEIRGYGLSGDAHHITAPSPVASGARRCMEMALRQAGLQPTDIDYVNAHATSTPMGDELENMAIKAVFGPHANHLAVSSTKGAVGHLLGAAGSVEAIFTIMALQTGQLPPTLNFHEGDNPTDFNLNYVPNVTQTREVKAALTNSFGFGGTNASLCFAKID